MQKQRNIKKILRKLCDFICQNFLSLFSSWRWLKFYPAIEPDAFFLKTLNEVASGQYWRQYQKWCKKHSYLSFEVWKSLQKKANSGGVSIKFSIVIPVYNTDISILHECILSVRAQVYPYWQLVLVDDGSSRKETVSFLRSGACDDPRISVHFAQQSTGIATATNIGLEKILGDYVVFLDHDDRLALDALFLMAQAIKLNNKLDIIYSDRDMISPDGKRYQHLFKPDWSPENLLAGNYIFHLMCYKSSLLKSLGGLRAEFDGSQDYDLILRAAEMHPVVKHIPKILYHWRQHENSVALDSKAKEYAFQAGLKALNESLKRRHIKGTAVEIEHLWRGNYQVLMEPVDAQLIEKVVINTQVHKENYTQYVNQQLNNLAPEKEFIALIAETVKPVHADALLNLAAWLVLENVGIASGSLFYNNSIEYVGASYQENGDLLQLYKGFSQQEIGYAAITQLVRNISAPHPYCLVIRAELWQKLGGLNAAYQGFYSVLDFTLRALALDMRCISVPKEQFIVENTQLLDLPLSSDKHLFATTWRDWLQRGDPYYNVNFNRNIDAPYHLDV